MIHVAVLAAAACFVVQPVVHRVTYQPTGSLFDRPAVHVAVLAVDLACSFTSPLTWYNVLFNGAGIARDVLALHPVGRVDARPRVIGRGR